MPALARIRPCRVATISTLGLARMTSAVSRRIASTSRASFLVICASSRARSLGSSAARSTNRLSALETTLLVTTTMSRERSVAPLLFSAAIRSAHRSSPGCTCGMPPSVVMVSPELLKVVGFLQFLCGGDGGDADAGAVDLVGAVDADEHGGERLARHRVGERSGVDAAQAGGLRQLQHRLAVFRIIAEDQDVAVYGLVLLQLVRRHVVERRHHAHARP